MNMITVLTSTMSSLRPLIELFLQDKMPKFIDHNITVESALKNGVETFIVYDLTQYATKEEAEKHVEIQLNLDSLAKTLSKK